MGLRYSKIAITSFIYGCIGASCALLMFWYMAIYDWPLIIGGKPNFSLNENLPAFIPITFEMTVFFASHLMVITFLFRCGLYPGSSEKSHTTAKETYMWASQYQRATRKVQRPS